MHFSQYLENAVFFEESPATAQLFVEKSHQLFEASSGKSYVEIHVQQPFLPQAKRAIPDSPSALHSSCSTNLHIRFNLGMRIEPRTPLDPTLDCQNDPPGYVGSRGLQVNTVTDPKELVDIAGVSRAGSLDSLS